MIKMKKALSLLMCFVLLFSMTACGLFDSTLIKSIKAMSKLESFHADITADCLVSADIDAIGSTKSIELDLTADAAADFILSPLQFRLDGTLTENNIVPDFIPLPGFSLYGESAGNRVNVYAGIDGQYKGYSLGVAGGSEFDTGALVKLLRGSSKLFKEAGSETIGSSEAVRYDGTITQEMLSSILALAGASEDFSITGSIPISVWIDKASFMMLRLDMDLSGISENFSSLLSNIVEINLGVLDLSLDLVPKSVEISILFSQFNSVQSIEVPEVIALSKA